MAGEALRDKWLAEQYSASTDIGFVGNVERGGGDGGQK